MPPPGGILVEFRLEPSGERLWSATMIDLPTEGDFGWWDAATENPAKYKVERLEYHFRQPTSLGGGTPTTDRCQHHATAFVSVVP